MKQQNLSPVLEILDVVDTKLWTESEVYWIAQMKAWGFELLNGTDGGEGSNGFKGKKHTDETKEKCRLAAQKRVTKTRLAGTTNGHSKLTEEQVREIKREQNMKVSELAIQYGVSKSLITNIRLNKRWSHIEV